MDDITTLGGGATVLQVEAADEMDETVDEMDNKVLVLFSSTGCAGVDVI